MKLKLLLSWVVLMTSIPVIVFSQARKITGKVMDQNGDPIPRASVIIRGTSSGISADENGIFSIEAPSSNSVIIISSVGYETRELKTGNANNLTVTLKSNQDLPKLL